MVIQERRWQLLIDLWERYILYINAVPIGLHEYNVNQRLQLTYHTVKPFIHRRVFYHKVVWTIDIPRVKLIFHENKSLYLFFSDLIGNRHPCVDTNDISKQNKNLDKYFISYICKDMQQRTRSDQTIFPPPNYRLYFTAQVPLVTTTSVQQLSGFTVEAVANNLRN